jgi:glutamyl-tRNA reductase
MQLIALGLNHATAPVSIRERIAFGPDILAGALRSLQGLPGIAEGAILSTCNRTEIYCLCDGDAAPAISAWLADFHGLQQEDLSPYLYLREQENCVRHLLEVASGLNSLVLGEPQILGQVKSAWQDARTLGALGKILDRLFQHAFATAKQVRTDTSIGESPVSVAFAAVTLSRQIFAELAPLSALLIGAGETIELAARHLRQQGIGRIIVANRTLSRAHELAAQFDGYGIGLTEVGSHLAEADIVISSTASPLPVLGKGTVERALKQRRHQPIFMVDIAVPRDIEPEVAELPDAYLYTVDDLHDVIQESLDSRQEAAEQAREIIDLRVEEFIAWMRSLDAVALIQQYRRHAEALRDEVHQKALRMMETGRPPEEALEYLAKTLTNKLLHQPSAQLREAGSSGRQDLLAAVSALLLPSATKDRR